MDKKSEYAMEWSPSQCNQDGRVEERREKKPSCPVLSMRKNRDVATFDDSLHVYGPSLKNHDIRVKRALSKHIRHQLYK